ncbi:hypothetical protein [Streptomyces sp. 049-1]|uniref:hypothetical protein n=1 Tax=Streptomyces sp. 049-1 TaxID=2789264 RepID=UPI00397E99C6
MSNPLPRQVLVAVGLCALLVLLFSCAAAVHGTDDTGDCWDLGLAAATKATTTARPAAPAAPRVTKAPARTARPAATPTRTSSARPHGHGGLDACP